ncbi:uncharacterized protein BP5553_10039 [Venustampulla echinocandica]|uniref:Uncharacterized protein n=1 Tax=Venustampulla echinocandica TaxID=2656787 RepID=A0A370TA68_9HELO|nr:uncharacterized protein BP5553_10039 [Venustampulla echinocandica]RDL30694.1 hypothetical protein BP5553_10039 [Venustampulla echinocandica]
MSGAEASIVLGVISSIITIVDKTKQVYEAANNVQGLPEAFREVAGRLPIVNNILDSAKQHIENGDVNEDSCKGVKDVVVACEEKAKKLDRLFHKTIPENDSPLLERYYMAVKALGKGNTVENLMKGILENVHLLACERGMKTATKAQLEQVSLAIKEVSAGEPSVPEHLFEETDRFTAINFGSGTQNNAQGEYIAQGDAKQYNIGSGTMNFGSNNTVQNISISHERQSRPEEDECLQALFLTNPLDDRQKLINAKGSRVDGTCEWIKTNKAYTSWLNSHSQLLWISGLPGKGKTMLAIFLAKELERTANTMLLQYFCDNNDEKRNTAVAIIRGLIFQLLQLQPKLFDYILPSFKIQQASLFTSTSFETLWRIFEAMVRDPVIGTMYCVLDGLDECDEDSLEVLLNKLKGLLSTESSESSACHLNLIIVSRDIPDFIPEILSSFPRIQLDTEVNGDIRLFIEAKVDELSAHRQYPEPLRVHVKKVFQKRAQGTFLWVGIVARQLRKYRATEVENTLELFPSGLEELYGRMLLQIDENRREIVARILRWVVMAVRPLTLSELSVALDVTPTATFTREEVMRDQVLHCQPFLTVKEENNEEYGEYEEYNEEYDEEYEEHYDEYKEGGDKVGFIHQSAKDYLLRQTPDLNLKLEFFRVREEVGNLDIARKCFAYLQDGAFTNGKVNLWRDTAHLKAFPLLSYAAFHWFEHAQSLARLEDIFDLSLPFYQNESRIRQSWLETYCSLDAFMSLPDLFPLLHLASYFGIVPLAQNILRGGYWRNSASRQSYVNQKNLKGNSALFVAALRGHEVIVQLLLENGADIEAGAGNVLQIAALEGHQAVVQLLLQKGVDVNALCNHGETALHRVAWSGDTAILLLEKGADVNASYNYSETALYRAAFSGHTAIVQLLLEKGADVNALCKDGKTALHGAAWSGHTAIVQLLLENGADIKSLDNNPELRDYCISLAKS